MSRIESSTPARASPSHVHPGSKFCRHFACGFHFRHSLKLPFAAVLSVLKGLIKVSVGTMGPSLFEDNFFNTVKGLVDYV